MDPKKDGIQVGAVVSSAYGTWPLEDTKQNAGPDHTPLQVASWHDLSFTVSNLREMFMSPEEVLLGEKRERPVQDDDWDGSLDKSTFKKFDGKIIWRTKGN